ncbi:MAG TPA: AMP-binding protein [Candidatus Rubrimentiphilum sp.]|nr:AMP-binding protein [Candidatus Rubrimentiphilum sp.]
MAGAKTEKISFGELMERSLAYANRYRSLGVNRGDVVIIILQHTPHLFYSYLGAILAGAIPSFMPFPTPKQRPELYWADHRALFERIEPRLLVTYEANLRNASETLAQFDLESLLAGDEVLEAGGKSHEDLAGFAADSAGVACLQHSSGTTSLKKGVMLTHQAIFGEVESYAKALCFGADDSIASWLPLYHDMGFVACFMSSVLLGTHLVALDPFEWVMRPTVLLDAIERYRTTFCWLPNFAFSHIVRTARPGRTWDLSSMRAFVNCSEPCKPATFERFVSRFGSSGISPKHLHVCYAMAENVFAVTQTPLDRPARVVADSRAVSVISCGLPVEGVRVEIRSEAGSRLPDGIVGEIYVSSPFLFSGYYRLPDETRKKLHGEWYASGDLGFVVEGELYVTGRIDDMIIVNGQNYYAHEIEAIVNGIASVIPGRSVAIGVEDQGMDATVVSVLAECAPQADTAVMGQDVRRVILEELGLAIHAFVPLQSGQLVKTTSGKISRSKNKEIYLHGGFG